ncbi:endoglucanase C307 precursor [mine drainage metagenome]|uniref:Endoglucanase C307 n=1 Tax=mine drainage metagenome TaxID=410659 RepID=A0A1J5TM84_9ZZZZ
MKLKQILTIAFFGLTISLTAQTKKFISVKGKEIIGVDGKPFLMRGTNLGNWLVPEGYMFKFKWANSPRLIQEMMNELIGPEESAMFWKKYLNTYITQADIHYLKTIGVNSIRIPFHYKLFTDEEYLGSKGIARGFKIMDQVISWCKQENIYVILDMHCAPGGQTGDNIDDSYGYPYLFESDESQKLIIDIWKKIALHYSNETAIIGYDLLNEPIAHYFDSSHFNHLLEPLYKKITKAIRTVDDNHLVFLGGSQWDSNFKIFGQPFDKKAVYTFHKYWTPPTKEVIQEYIDFSNKYQVPIYCGETGENDDNWVMQFKQLLEKENIGWHYWPYKKMNNTRGIVTFPVPKYYDQIIQFADTVRFGFGEIRNVRPKNSEQIKQALEGFLQNASFKNCYGNKGYIEALGFHE